MEKSIQASIAAIEVYNKPDFKYREECFCILMTNAWELLFKARILHNNSNNIRAIICYESCLTKKGSKSKKAKIKTNRCGNPLTIDVFKSMEILSLDEACNANVELLIEVRDNSVHFINQDSLFSQKVLEIGTACLRNYVNLIQQWFDYDLSKFNFYLMPISFFQPSEIENISISRTSKPTEKLLNFIVEKEIKHPSDVQKLFNVSLRLETKFVKSFSPNATEVFMTNNPNVTHIYLSEGEMLTKYPFDYNLLYNECKNRYVDFKVNEKYHSIRKKAESDPKLFYKRELDPGNPKSAYKKRYGNGILEKLDQHYTKHEKNQSRIVSAKLQDALTTRKTTV